MDQETFTLLRDTVRRFVDQRLIPAEDQVEHDDLVPEAIVAEMRELGLFQPFRRRADLDGRETIIEIELLRQHRAQRLVVVDQENLLAAIVYGHAYATCQPSQSHCIRYDLDTKAARFSKIPPAW